MDQLNEVRNEHELRLHGATMQMSKEYEKSQKKLENKGLTSLASENSYLTKALLVKEKLIDDLNNIKYQKEAEFEALMTILDSTEKENTFLRYEFRALEKELDIRNEEMEYGRRWVEASNKQNSDNVKKIKKLEAECQRLRVLTCKRFPSPIALANIKSDIEVRGRKAISLGNAGKKMSGSFIDQIHDLEKENKILKESLARKEEAILYHQNMDKFSDRLSFASSRSWATNTLVSEHEHNKFIEDLQTEPEIEMIGACSEMSLMDDFVEMEKLAIVSTDVPLGDMNEAKRHDWLQDVRNIILEQHNITKRNVDEILGHIKTALEGNFRLKPSNLPPVSGYITWKSPTSENYVSYQDHPTIRDEFQKYLGGTGPGTAFELESMQTLMLEMEKMYSVFQVEIQELKSELSFVKSSDESRLSIASLQNEMEMLRESKRMSEDQIENLKMINVDLDTQLIVTKAKFNDLRQKLCSVEVELDNKIQCYEELEGNCLELQLHLASITNNEYSEENKNQEELLQTGMEITKASVKLAVCEQTIMKLGKQLNALGSAKELLVVEEFNLSFTDTKNKTLKQHSSLRDRMICEDKEQVNILMSPKTKEIISTANENAPPVICNAFAFSDGQVATPKTYVANDIEALVVAPNKKRIGFLRKLLLRGKKYSSKNIYFGE